MESYILIDNLNLDNIYYYKSPTEEYITIVDIKFNKYPDMEKKKRMFSKDLNDLGLILL